MRGKPNAGAARRRNEHRLWQLYQIAFQRLTDRHICLPPHLDDEAGDRTLESAENIAHHALTLALAAASKWKTYEERNQCTAQAVDRDFNSSRNHDAPEPPAKAKDTDL